MNKIIIAIFIISISAPAKASFSHSDGATYVTFGIGLVLKNTLSHFSKKLSSKHQTMSILIRCASDATLIFLVKETSDFALQSFKDVAPDWLKPRKNKGLEAENTRLQQELENLRRASSLATNSLLQAERITQLKEMLLSTLLKQTLSEIDQSLSSGGFWNFSTDNSLNIANILSQFIEQTLILYPGYVDENNSFLASPDKKQSETGESYFYNATLISEQAEKSHLKNRISEKTLAYLTEKLKTMVSKKALGKAEYFLHLLGLLGIDIELPEPDRAPKTTDL